MIYVVTILFTLSFVLYSKYQFADEKAGWSNAKGEWHPYGLGMRALLFAALLVYKFFPFDIWDLLVCVALNVLFDIGINIVLDAKLFYTGKTSKLDKMFGSSKWYLYAVLFITSILGKIFIKNKKQ